MLIIGCDYHPGFQQIAFVDTETGELGERRLTHREEAEQFYGSLKGRTVRVGMEASGNSHETSAQAKDRSSGCAIVAEAADGRSLSEDLGTGCRKSRPAATALASASVGPDAHAPHESAACGSTQRRSAAQEGAVAVGGSQRTGVLSACSLGQQTTSGFARCTRPTHSEDPGTDPCVGRRGG